MPIFVSRFSSDRVAGANLQQVRSNQDQTIESPPVRTLRREVQPEQNQQTEDSRIEQLTSRLRETLPVASALADRLTERLQTARQGQSADTEQVETDESNRPEEAPSAQTERVEPSETSETPELLETRTTERNNRRPVVLPGVGAVRTQADEAVDRPGRLDRGSVNTVRDQLLARFTRLREVGRETAGQVRDVQNDATELNPVQTPARADFENDVQRSNQILDVRTSEINLAVSISAGASTIQTEPTVRPTAEQISQANTTPEIRQNIQGDSREVARGLTRDAVVQIRENTQRTVENAAQAVETRQEDVRQESQTQVRELQTEQRRLERDLQQTEGEIREQRLQLQRADSSASRGTITAAASIGSNINILAG